MVDAFRDGGVMMWPLLLIAVGILVAAARAAWELHRGDVVPADAERRRHAILFWGALSVGLGFLGSVVGVVVMTQAIMMAGEVEARLVWGGVGVVLITLLFGLVIFLVASVLWFALRQWHQRQLAGHRPGVAA